MMKNRIAKILFLGSVASLPLCMNADEDVSGVATPRAAPNGSQIQTQLWIQVKDDTKNVKLISTNTNPNVITKTYVLKNADPYELLPYFQTAVKAQRTSNNTSKVECMKFNDGTGVLIVSAEAYRFGKQAQGMGFDEILEALDRPGVTASSGTVGYAYFPKYVSADWLSAALHNVGMNQSGSKELQGGKDKIIVDKSLNALFVYVPSYQVKNINEMIKQYDTPVSEVNVKYTVYELDSEIDGSIGVDFQAWKNGPGAEFLNIAGRYGQQWDFAKNIVNYPTTGRSHTQFINFSPKWNSKYLDFLMAKSKASIVTSGNMSIMNNQDAKIEATTRMAEFRDGFKYANIDVISYIRLQDQRVYDFNVSSTVNPDATGGLAGRYRLTAYTEKGVPIALTSYTGTTNNFSNGAQPSAVTPYRGDLQITRMFDGSRYYYYLELNENEAANQQAQFVAVTAERQSNGNLFLGAAPANIGANGNGLGYKTQAYDVKLEKLTATPAGVGGGVAVAGTQEVFNYAWVNYATWDSSENFQIQRDVSRDTVIDGYGFVMNLRPVTCEKSSTLDISMANTSLIGFQDTGAPRTSKSEMSTKVMVNNNGSQFVIGGLEKKSIVTSVSKLPWLGDIPGLGWLLGSESPTTKKSQLVVVLECTPVMPETRVMEAVRKEIDEMTEKVVSAGEKWKMNEVGFDQYLLDGEKKGIDPLP
ncbi:MAG TPA: hypothetical protein DET40_12365 [Lentisphaeria bacterium]|nr:MAG: hypothetical protein A2X45_00350 [Lentisphaerae bacterium GWF2_50_93]HCE44333.1 hypothetical protein [Lentisphaeria bacterium]